MVLAVASLLFIPFCLWLSFQAPPSAASLGLDPTPDYFATAWSTAVSPTPVVIASVTPAPSPTATIWKYDPLAGIAAQTATAAAFPSPVPSDHLFFNLSFYDPHIGAYFPDIASINCLQFDFGIGDCVSKVNQGQDDYRIWYRRGVACPGALKHDTVFQVIQPVQLAGTWRCIDVGALDRGEYHYIDFMLEYPDDIWTGDNLDNFPWSSVVEIKILSLP